MKKLIFLVLCLCSVVAFAQEAPKEVSLVVTADGATKTEAVNNAFRYAIEQTFGTFVSANTEILNDELVKDEIATVSSGNIQKYEEVASVTLPNGNTSVTLNVTISLQKLVKYAKSKGSECEFAGATFEANLRIYEFNKRNEQIAIQNMIKQLDALRPVYDYEIKVSEPVLNKTVETRRQNAESKEEMKTANIDIQIIVKSNDRTRAFNEIIRNTIMSLAMTEKQIKPMKESGFEYKPYLLYLDGEIKKIQFRPLYMFLEILPDNVFYFYTNAIDELDAIINNAMYDFSITDNTGNEFLLFDGIGIYDGMGKSDVSIGHRIIYKSINHKDKVCWGFENESREIINGMPNGPYIQSPLFNTHLNYVRIKEINKEAPHLLAINTSKTVWILPKIPFTIPVENINNISKISIKPAKENATNFLISGGHPYYNVQDYYGAIDVKMHKHSIFTKYNLISSDQTKINDLKKIRSKKIGFINVREIDFKK